MKDKIKEILEGKIHVMDIDSVTEEINLAIYDHFIPMLDLAESKIRNGCKIENSDSDENIWFIESGSDEVVAVGETLRNMLINFYWLETGDLSET